jgi:methylated-DNA-[protein]-cysteine S-methyltransferase
MGRCNTGALRNEDLRLSIDRVDTPIGQMLIVADREETCALWIGQTTRREMHRLLRLHYGDHGFGLEPAPDPNALAEATGRYFQGELRYE